MSGSETDSEVVDGRRRRRERGRMAVIDAAIDLILEHGTPPPADVVAERAGVSQASLFRYFATLDDLRSTAITRYFERFDDLIAIPDIGDGTLPERIDRFIGARDAFYARTAPMARLTRRQLTEVPDFATTIDRLRATLADQIAHHFAPELDRLDEVGRTRRIAVLAALTSFEAWDQLDGLGPTARRQGLVDAVTELLPRSG